MTSSSNYLSLTSKHVDSLIDYILDVKPYHTKLLQVSEEYTFADDINVDASDEHSFVIFMGADIVDPSTYAGTGRPSSKSWLNSFVSNGARRKFQAPLVAHPKFMSHLNSENFVCGVDDDTQIPGLTLGAFNQVRWDGPGITLVTKNSTQQQENVDFFISHGVYSFDILSNCQWKRMDIDVSELSNVENSSGGLLYRDVDRYYGSITGIYVDPALADYEEWTLTCTYVDGITAMLEVAGSVSGVIGIAAFDVLFSDPKIQFTFAAALDDSPGTVPPIVVGDIFVLTPHNKITIHPDASEETWSLIKVNPICVSAVTVSSGNLGSIQVYPRSLAFTPTSSWTVEFVSSTRFEVRCATIAGYGIGEKGQNVVDGVSYKDENIHFTLIPPAGGFQAGDKFDFSIFADKPVYKVFGSTSGWAADALLDTWYWNGKIGFKVPSLEHFPVIYRGGQRDLLSLDIPFLYPDFLVDTAPTYPTDLPQCKKKRLVHSMAEASVYEVTFISEDASYKYATVRNNRLGSLRGLKLPVNGSVEWSDEFVAFEILDAPTPFNVGDVVAVYIAPSSIRTIYGGYDILPYEFVPYDSDIASILYPRSLLEDYFPLFHSHGTVIFPSITIGDQLVIDKAIFETLQLKVTGASTNAMLAGEDNDWVPLEFRYSDTAFSDLTVTVVAYLATDPDYEVLTLSQPRYLSSNISASSTIEFSQQFVQDYLPIGTAVSIRALQYNPTGNQVRVKITESVQFVLTDIDDDNADNSMNFGIYGEFDGVANANENLPTGPIVIQIDEKYNQLNNPPILQMREKINSLFNK